MPRCKRYHSGTERAFVSGVCGAIFITLKDEGHQFHEADLQERKRIFAEHLVKHIPLVRRILQILNEQADHKARENRIFAELEAQVNVEDAQEILNVAINWARYAELFSYDYNSGILSLVPRDA